MIQQLVFFLILTFFENLVTSYDGNFFLQYQITLQNFSNLDVNFPYGIPVPTGETTEGKGKEYDFIIVGSGSAGSVIANRLSEIGTWKILLLEAGYPENFFVQIPLIAGVFQFTDYNWDYTSEPQDKICRAMIKQRCGWPRGKALGGSTVINYMIYNRGNPQDYDRWAALGNPGWSYKDVLPYFLKSEDSRLRSSNARYHGKGGLLSVEDPFESDLTTTFLKASEELGYKLVDYNSPDYFGFARIQATIKQGRRHSVAEAFLKPVLHRKNLNVVSGARVTKILINPSTNTAYGVRYKRRGRIFSARAKKEVIVSAGALSSPQLLMLSGVGPKNNLEEVGIKLLVDLPVGETLYDHIGFVGLSFDLNTTVEPLIKNAFDPVQILRWHKTGVGFLSSLGGLEALGYIKTSNSEEKGDYPDIEIIFGGAGGLQSDYGLINRRTLKISDEYYYKMYLPIEGTPGVTMFPMLLHPRSKGYMKLRSSNPYHHPLFYGNYLSDPADQDIKTMIEGIRFTIKLVETEAFKKYNARINPKPYIGCEHLPFNSDEYWRCAMQFLVSSLHHQTTTCKMGPISDNTSVVNHELKVHGVKNLRVADTSVIPLTLSGHTNAPSIMIGEKASDMIKEEWGAR